MPVTARSESIALTTTPLRTPGVGAESQSHSQWGLYGGYQQRAEFGIPIDTCATPENWYFAQFRRVFPAPTLLSSERIEAHLRHAASGRKPISSLIFPFIEFPALSGARPAKRNVDYENQSLAREKVEPSNSKHRCGHLRCGHGSGRSLICRGAAAAGRQRSTGRRQAPARTARFPG